jgi:hypothetical protein
VPRKIKEKPIVALDSLGKNALHENLNSRARCFIIRQCHDFIEPSFISKKVADALRIVGGRR